MAIVTLTSSTIKICLSTFGASWLSCQLGHAYNKKSYREILLSCDEKDLPKQDMYLGASVGRYANRIANAQFSINNQTYNLSANQNNQHTLHGGADNLSYREWQIVKHSDNSVTFAIHSHNGDQGFNGNFIAYISYTVTDQQVIIDYTASNDQPSICSLTNHAYFNLNGVNSVYCGRYQYLQILSDRYMPINADGLPIDNENVLTSVKNSPFDFTQKKLIKQDFDKLLETDDNVGGYDHDWYFGDNGVLKKVCVVTSFDNSLNMTISTTHPALHLYSGNFLHGLYQKYKGIALETGCLANSPNLTNYQNECLIAQDKPYCHQTIYRFDW